MPRGLVNQLPNADLVDLPRFLSELGKGPYGSAGMPVARRWRVLDPPMGEGSSVTPELLDANASLTWAPVYAEVGGTVPVSAFTPAKSRTILRTQIEVTTAGAINVKLNSAAGLRAWLDNAPIDVQGDIRVDAAPGVHTLTFLIENRRRGEGLRCELVEVPGSPAKVQFVAGR